MNPDKADQVIDQVIAVLKAAPALAEVKRFRRTNGLVPGTVPEISVGVEAEEFKEYTRAQDENNCRFNIFVSLEDRDVERGERRIRRLAKAVKGVLTAGHALAGVVSASFVRRIRYVYYEDKDDLVAAIVELETVFYEARLPAAGAPPVASIQLTAERG